MREQLYAKCRSGKYDTADTAILCFAARKQSLFIRLLFPWRRNERKFLIYERYSWAEKAYRALSQGIRISGIYRIKGSSGCLWWYERACQSGNTASGWRIPDTGHERGKNWCAERILCKNWQICTKACICQKIVLSMQTKTRKGEKLRRQENADLPIAIWKTWQCTTVH